MASSSDLWFLENVNLFDFLCPSKLMDFDRSQVQTDYNKADFVYFPDEPSDKVYLISKGRVKIGSYSSDGKEVIKAILQAGEIFGELSLAGEGVRGDFAQAMDDGTEVCWLRLDDIMDLMRESKDFSLKLTRIMGMRLIKAERRLESLVFKDARTRIVEYLKELATDQGKPVGDEMLVNNFLTHKEIANLTGTSRQTVTTVLNELREQNLIYFDRKRLLVRDTGKLV